MVQGGGRAQQRRSVPGLKALHRATQTCASDSPGTDPSSLTAQAGAQHQLPTKFNKLHFMLQSVVGGSV